MELNISRVAQQQGPSLLIEQYRDGVTSTEWSHFQTHYEEGHPLNFSSMRWGACNRAMVPIFNCNLWFAGASNL
jgi:hypothetical protein